METRSCKECDHKLSGRRDQKFCSDYCRNTFNNQVQNGVYFCRLTLAGKIYWTKLMVINT